MKPITLKPTSMLAIRATCFTLLALVFFAQGAILFAAIITLTAGFMWLMWSQSAIILDETGFTVQHFIRRNSYRWLDIDPNRSFVIYTRRALLFIPVYRSVGWYFTKSYSRMHVTRFLSRATGRPEASLDALGNKSKEVAAMMTFYLRQAHSRASSGIPAVSSAPIVAR